VKRSPIKRKTPLKRTAMARAKARLVSDPKPLSARRRRQLPNYSQVREVVFERAGWRCEIAHEGCTGRAEHCHHRLMRSAGGKDEAANLLAACHRCHEHIHANPALSYEHGWLQRKASA
jgi:hypothetical protein